MPVRALFFDVFGTLVDWRASIAREAEKLLGPLGHSCDWHAFADAWRGEYQPAMEDIRSGRMPFCKLDVLHRHNLERILSPSQACPTLFSLSSISRGIGSTRGRIPRPDWRACAQNFRSRRCRTAIFH
jgi:hypothetical protein